MPLTSTQLCLTLCNPMDCRPPGSSVHGIFQARILEWVATSFSRISSQPRDWTQVSLIVDRCFTIWATRESESEVTQSCPTLCDPVDCSPPGSSVHGILQARILEWVAISFSRGSSRPRDWTQVSCIAGRRFNIWAIRGYSKCEDAEVNVSSNINPLHKQPLWMFFVGICTCEGETIFKKTF